MLWKTPPIPLPSPLFPHPPPPPSSPTSQGSNAKPVWQRTAAGCTPSASLSMSLAWATTSSHRPCTTHASARATAQGCFTTATIPRTTPSSKRSSMTWASATSLHHPACLTNTCPWVCWWCTKGKWSTRSWTIWWLSHAPAARDRSLVLSMTWRLTIVSSNWKLLWFHHPC